MGDEEIPCLDFSSKAKMMIENGRSEKWWKEMSEKVRDACENHGCFVLVCDEEDECNSNNVGMSTNHLRERMLMGMRDLFDLPEETKHKHMSSKPYSSYSANSPVIPLSQSFGIDEDTPHLEAATSFTNLLWAPHGNPTFCETLNSMSKKLKELGLMVLKMIYESFEMDESYFELQVDNNLTTLIRLMKYNVPDHNHDHSSIGLVAHTDINALTILCQNEVQGLQVLSKQGKWTPLLVPNGSFIVIIGDALKAWSNGRLRAAKHRVMMKRGEKQERYSYALFLMHKEGVKIEVPKHLIDEKHPLLYRPFLYQDYVSFFVSNATNSCDHDHALEIFAGINSCT